MRPSRAWPLLVILAVSAPATGADLLLSMSGSVEYDSNVFRSENDEKQDGVFRGVPGLTLDEQGEELTYRLSYTAPYSRGFTQSDISYFDHIGSATASYSVTDRLRVYGSERFSYRRFLARQFEDTGGGDSELNNNLRRVTTNDASVGFSYELAPRLAAVLESRHQYFSSDQENQATTWTLNTSGLLRYTLSPRHQLSAGPSFTYQTFDDQDFREGSETFTYGLRGIWRWIIDDTTELSVTLVPSLFDQNQDDTSGSLALTYPGFLVAPGVPPPLNLGIIDSDGNLIDSSTDFSRGGILVNDFATCPTAASGNTLIEGCFPGLFLNNADSGDSAAIAVVENSRTPTESAQGSSDKTFAMLGEVSLTRRWTPTLSSRASYVRRQSAASGLGGTTILDAVSFSTDWTPFERWQVGLRGDWAQRESVAESTASALRASAGSLPGVGFGGASVAMQLTDAMGVGLREIQTQDNAVDTRRWAVAGRVEHRLARRTRISLRLSYDKQSSKDRTSGVATDFQNYSAMFGVRHEFEPVQLW